MGPRITALETFDIRFPTSEMLDGSDAMNPDPDYSAAYVIVRTDEANGPSGHGFAFTIGRGNDVQVAAIDALAPLLVGSEIDEVLADMGRFWQRLISDSQLRWLGPEKGVIHMATAAVVNAVWDLYAKREGKPLWKLLADFEPRQLVDLVDFRYISDAIAPDEALELLTARAAGRAEREAALVTEGYPAYTTSPGWLGYDDAKLQRLLLEAIDDGFDHVKLKVGADLEDDVRRCALARTVLGPERTLMIDANQRWDVGEAISNLDSLRAFKPRWIEEPTSPDDVLGHATIGQAVTGIEVASGEHAHNRVMFKQFMQAKAIDICQIDACRLGGVNEVIAVLLLATKFDIPVCPHAGGVGLCELVQHLSAFDFVAVSGSRDGRVIEYVDQLSEHFVDPCVVQGGRYRVPTAPGYSSEMLATTLRDYAYPHGPVWASKVVA
ncbi:MAG: fuconate dehydratase [Actinobacteria bacterium]|nr:fuconate dehydratase [Actinomycetota bacterium]